MAPTAQRIAALDIVRGYCLVIMTIDHLPSSILRRFSSTEYGPLGFFTAASVFVFISGVTSARVYGRVFEAAGAAATWRRAGRRALQLYAVNIGMLLAVFAGMTSGLLSGPAWEHEFGLFHHDPVSAVVQAVLLLYRPGYFDILPMYVVFLLAVPWSLALIARGRVTALLVASVLLWVVAQIAVDGRETLSPLGYQLLFVTGLILGTGRGTGAWLQQSYVLRASLFAALLVVAALILRVASGFSASVHELIEPLHHWTSMEHNGPLRLLNFSLFALVAAVWWNRVVEPFRRHPVTRTLELLGRHALPVFAWSVLATYVSLGLAPAEPTKAWRIADMLLVVLSLAVPSVVSGWLSRHRRSQSAAPLVSTD